MEFKNCVVMIGSEVIAVTDVQIKVYTPVFYELDYLDIYFGLICDVAEADDART